MSLLHTFCPGKKAFVPKNKEKFVGSFAPIRSSYEEKFAKWCDKTPSVVKWAYESVAIPYYDPVRRRMRRYYPDFTLAVQDQKGKVNSFLVEVKPAGETKMPRNRGNKQLRVHQRQVAMYLTNAAKWKAAQLYCAKNNMQFRILSEDHLEI